MQHTLTLYADVPSTDGAFLLEVAVGLGAYRLRPETLTWMLTGRNKVKLGIVVVCEQENHLSELVARFQNLHGVSKVEIETLPKPAEPPVITD